MKQLPIAYLLLAALCCLPASARAENCSGLPTSFSGGNEFPKGNFFSNFDNNCYLIALSSGNGGTSERGDLNSLYNKLFFNINNPNLPAPAIPPYEIIILGQYPNARYFSISLYDDHSAFTQNIGDVGMVPLTSSDSNPYEPGVAFVSGQRYGVALHLGGTPGNLQTGCMMTGYNVESNVMDGTQRHPFMNWNLDTAFMSQGIYPDHVVDTPGHTNPNTSGAIIIRSYLDLTASSSSTQPHIIVRDVASGCAYPAAYIKSLGNIVTTDATDGNTWQDQDQVQEHNTYANWQATNCWAINGWSKLQWLRQDEYVAGSNSDTGYLIVNVPSGLPQQLASANEVMLMQFQVPTTPPTPCTDGCSRSGSEQMRYMSVSFEVTGGGTLASLPDSCPANPVSPCTPLVQTANGYVTLVVGTGTPQPSWVTAANGYTWIDLSQLGNPNYVNLNEIAIRHILPSSFFGCAAQLVPYKTEQPTTQNGQVSGLMGQYAPLISYPVATTLYTTAPPFPATHEPSGCDVFPDGPPQNGVTGCEVLPANPTAISAVVSQCAAPGCSGITVQPAPPIAIQGAGFGSFPLGLPYKGDTNFVRIDDTTQGWSAGNTGNACTVTIGEWSDSLVSLVANVNQNGACPMAANDSLSVTIWNPQTLTSSSMTTTVLAQTGGVRKP